MSAITYHHQAAIVVVANAALDMVCAVVHVLQAIAAGIQAFLGFFGQ